MFQSIHYHNHHSLEIASGVMRDFKLFTLFQGWGERKKNDSKKVDDTIF